MDVFEMLIIATVQGMTEFLPVSSSAHTVLVAHMLGPEIQSVAVDIVLHGATLLAVVIYFARDIGHHIKGVFLPVEHGTREYAHSLILATFPILIVGAFAYQGIEVLRVPSVIASALIVSGLALIIADYAAQRGLVDTKLPLKKKGFGIGVFQTLALIPGVSRSGITIAAARSFGFSRKEATRFSFLLSVPTIFAALTLTLVEHIRGDTLSSLLDPVLGIGFIIAFAVAYITIHFFFNLVNRIGFLPFFVYQVLLGGVIFFVF